MRLLRRSFHSLLSMTDEFRIYCDETPQSSYGMTQGLWNSRILVIASEAKQSLGILNLF